MRRIQFLSQNRPGALMGMGHYERLLFKHFLPLAAPSYRFGISFSGRAPGELFEPRGIAPEIEEAAFLGISTERLFDLPLALAEAAVARAHRKTSIDLYHSFSAGFPAPDTRKTPAIYFIHDLPPARFEDEGRIPRWTRQAAHKARLILAPSQFAKEELVELLNLPDEKVRVVRHGCEHENFHAGVLPAAPGVLQELKISGPFLIYVGGFTRRKNVAALLQAWQSIAREYSDLSLVLAGPPEQLGALVEKTPAPRVIVAGYQQRQTLSALMKASQGLVFPSIYEGFGLPPLEALALGVPVIAVRAGAVPEVVGECAALAENGEPDSLAAAMRISLDDDALREERVRCGLERVQDFSWPRNAQETLEIYEEILG